MCKYKNIQMYKYMYNSARIYQCSYMENIYILCPHIYPHKYVYEIHKKIFVVYIAHGIW